MPAEQSLGLDSFSIARGGFSQASGPRYFTGSKANTQTSFHVGPPAQIAAVPGAVKLTVTDDFGQRSPEQKTGDTTASVVVFRPTFALPHAFHG